MNWTDIPLHGAASVERVCGVYEFQELARVPGTRFKIKVIESASGGFLAVPNLAVRGPDGAPEWTSGGGATEVEALQRALQSLMAHIDALEAPRDDQFEWADSRDF